MDTYIEQLGGKEEIAKYISRGIKLQSIAKKNGIKRFGPATEKKVLEFYNKYYNSDSISDKITANYPNIIINPLYIEGLNRYKTQIEDILSFLNNDIKCGSWYKEDIANSVVDIVIRDLSADLTNKMFNDILNVGKDPISLKKSPYKNCFQISLDDNTRTTAIWRKPNGAK